MPTASSQSTPRPAAASKPSAEPAPQALTSPLPSSDAAPPSDATPAPATANSAAEKLRPEQLRRIEAYSTRGQPLLVERIAATREVLQRTPDAAYSVELYLTLNTDPARIERFLMRARDLVGLSNVYVIPLTGGGRTRIWVIYGIFDSVAEAEAAAQRLPPKYREAFRTVVRDFAELRGSL